MSEWFSAPGYEGLYEVSREGQVRTCSRVVNSPATGGHRTVKAKLVKLQNVKGYPGFLAPKADGRKTTVYLHRLMAALFVPNPYGKPNVNHIDGDKGNFDPANLEWVTHQENMRHALDAGLMSMPPSSGPGDKSPAAKLTWATVAEIRDLLRGGETHSRIAAKFGVKKGAIGCIARNETWRIET